MTVVKQRSYQLLGEGQFSSWPQALLGSQNFLRARSMQLGREKNPTLLHALMAWLNCPRQSASVGVGTAFKGAVATAWGGGAAG